MKLKVHRDYENMTLDEYCKHLMRLYPYDACSNCCYTKDCDCTNYIHNKDKKLNAINV